MWVFFRYHDSFVRFGCPPSNPHIFTKSLPPCSDAEEKIEKKMASPRFSSSSSFSIDVLFAAVFAIARAELRSSSSPNNNTFLGGGGGGGSFTIQNALIDNEKTLSPQGFARLFVHATVLVSGWQFVASSSFETTYRFDPGGFWEDALDDDDGRRRRNVLTVRSLDVGRKSVSFTFSFAREEEERRMDDETEKKYSDEDEDDVKTLLVSCPADEAWKSSSVTNAEERREARDAAARTFGEDVVKLMVKEKIVEFGKAKEKECAKCKEWERRERERERENRREGGYSNREDPFRRGQPLFPGQPLRPGMGPRIDYIGPPDMPDFGRDF